MKGAARLVCSAFSPSGFRWLVSRMRASKACADADGQTPTEYLMLGGLGTAFGIVVLSFMFPPFRTEFQKIIDCMVDDYDVCMTGTSWGGPPPPPPPPPPCNTFVSPTVNGIPLDWCVTWATGCGLPMAQKWCQMQGCSGTVVSWSMTKVPKTYLPTTGQTCNVPWGNVCGTFTSIVCG
ncbi:MAG: hypothetical protein HYX76_12550 [Acidobacteria bacterium]|nr:hypothetical protein [Acidobacteriota bacterium]